MPVGGISGFSTAVYGAERISNAVENQNQRQQELRERPDVSRQGSGTAVQQSAQGAVTFSSIRPVSGSVFSSLADEGGLLLSADDIKTIEIEKQANAALESVALAQAEEQGKLEDTQEYANVLTQIAKQNATEEQQISDFQQQERAFGQFVILQTVQEDAQSFATLTRAREAFAAALRLQESTQVKEGAVAEMVYQAGVDEDFVTFGLEQLQLTEAVNQNNRVNQSLFEKDLLRESDLESDKEKGFVGISISV